MKFLYFGTPKVRYFNYSGEVPEWLNGLPWKGSVLARVPRVRIPLSPQEELKCSIILMERHFWMNKRKQ